MTPNHNEEIATLTAGLRLPVWYIELFEAGEWAMRDSAHTEEDALLLASRLADYLDDDCIRIRTPTGQIL